MSLCNEHTLMTGRCTNLHVYNNRMYKLYVFTNNNCTGFPPQIVHRIKVVCVYYVVHVNISLEYIAKEWRWAGYIWHSEKLIPTDANTDLKVFC